MYGHTGPPRRALVIFTPAGAKVGLEVVAEFVRQFQALDAGKAIFDAYDQFLAILGNTEKRTRLE